MIIKIKLNVHTPSDSVALNDFFVMLARKLLTGKFAELMMSDELVIIKILLIELLIKKIKKFLTVTA